MEKNDKAVIATGSVTTAAGTAAALGGKAALWAAFSAGPGAALTGAAETSAFLAWVGGGSLAAEAAEWLQGQPYSELSGLSAGLWRESVRWQPE